MRCIVKILLNFVLIFFVVYTDVGLIVVDHDRKGMRESPRLGSLVAPVKEGSKSNLSTEGERA